MEQTGISISIIVCTFNPDEAVFKKCLNSISSAAKRSRPLEILIIDNRSIIPVASLDYIAEFLDAHPYAGVIREEKQGLTPARLRGIRESTGSLIIFIDDDNFVDENYFEEASRIASTHPFIGSYSGQVTLEYDTEPEEWTRRYWGMLIHRTLEADVWSNQPFNNDAMPNGAGLCVTREVAQHYVRLYDNGKRSFNLDRSGGSLLSGGDNDLAMGACDIGKGMGLFRTLHLKHKIPAKRFTLDYLSRLAYGIYFSSAILLYMRTGKIDSQTFKKRVKHLVRTSIMRKQDRVIQQSCRKGLKDAADYIRSNAEKLR